MPTSIAQHWFRRLAAIVVTGTAMWACQNSAMGYECCPIEIRAESLVLTPCQWIEACSCGVESWELTGSQANLVVMSENPYTGCVALSVPHPEGLEDGELTLTAYGDSEWCELCELAECEDEVTITIEGFDDDDPPGCGGGGGSGGGGGGDCGCGSRGSGGGSGSCSGPCGEGLGDGTSCNESVYVKIGMGLSEDGRSAGKLIYKLESPTSEMPSASELRIAVGNAGIKKLVPMPADQYKFQIKVPAGLAQIVDLDTTTPGFQAEFYTNEAAGPPDQDGIYSPAGAFRTWSFNRVGDILCQFTDGNKYFEYTYSSAVPSGWTMVERNGTESLWTVTRLSESTGPTTRTETYAVKNGSGALQYKEEIDYNQVAGREVIEERRRYDDLGGVLQTYRKGFYVDGSNAGKIKFVQKYDGSWVWFDYDAEGNVEHEIRPWLDVALDDVNTDPPGYDLARTISYDYSSLDVTCDPTTDANCDAGNDSRPRIVTEAVAGVPVSRTFYQYSLTDTLGDSTYRPTELVVRDLHPEVQDTQARFAAAENPRTVTIKNASCVLPECPVGAGKIVRSTTADGLLYIYTYEAGTYTYDSSPHPSGQPGTFAVATGGDARRETVVYTVEGAPNGVNGHTTKELSVFDSQANLRLKETYVLINGSYEGPIRQELFDYDAQRHLVRTTNALDGIYAEQSWTCCQQEWVTDPVGIKTLFDYDGFGRLWKTTKEASPSNIVTEHFYDDLSRETSRITTATDPTLGTLQRQTGQTFDVAGRVLTQTDASGLVTEYKYELTSTGGSKVTVARPGDTLQDPTQITEYFVDGRIKRVYGKGVVEKNYEYGVAVDGTQSTTVYTGPHDPSSSPSPRWVTTVTDCLGRTVREEKPAFNDGTNPPDLVTQYEYYTDNATGHGKGRLKAIKPALDLAHTVYEYDLFGNVILTGTDVDNNGLSASSNDRIEKTETEYRSHDGALWTVTTRRTCPYGGSSPAEVVLSEDWTQLTGLSALLRNVHKHVAYYHDGTNQYPKTTLTWSEVDRTLKRMITWTQYPDSDILGKQENENGLLTGTIDRHGASLDYTYDALERPRGIVRPNTGESITAYVTSTGADKLKGRVDYVADADGRTTKYFYNTQTGQITAIENPLGYVQRLSYTERGETERVWGDVPYPIEYEYNTYGERTKMRTYRGPDTPPGYWSGAGWPTDPANPQETTWTYDPATGLLTAKTDANSKSVTYSYKPDGRLYTRTWARGLTTTYDYYDTGALRTGELMSVTYSDGTTPKATYTYTRGGQVQSVSDTSGIGCTYTYKPTSELESETDAALTSLTRQYGTSGRDIGKRTGVTVTSPGIPTYAVGYSYNNFGQLRQVTGPGLLPEGVTYNYANQSNAPAWLAHGDPQSPRAWTSYTYEYEATQNPTARELIRAVQSSYRP